MPRGGGSDPTSSQDKKTAVGPTHPPAGPQPNAASDEAAPETAACALMGSIPFAIRAASRGLRDPWSTYAVSDLGVWEGGGGRSGNVGEKGEREEGRSERALGSKEREGQKCQALAFALR